MLLDNDRTYDDDMNFQNFEFCEFDQRQKGPFPPIGGGNFPPIGGNFPPGQDKDFNPPKFDYDYSPNFNYPGGNFNPPGMPKSPPPNYIPQKNQAGVQKMSIGVDGVQPYAVSASSIRFCLYKYTYIWERSGRSYWAFLLNVSRRTVSGFRWFRNTWVYFGVDLRRIDSFVCYRNSEEDDCDNCANMRQSDTSSYDTTKEYLLNGSRDVFTKTLASIDIPETKEDFITRTIGCIDDTNIESEIPCVKARNISYRIALEVSYPSSFDENSKTQINELANEASNDVLKVISSIRNNYESSSPIENYNSSLQLIPHALKTFNDSFNSKISSLDSSIANYNDITFSIRNEKICNNWKTHFYNESFN